MATVLKPDPYSVIYELAVCISLHPKRVKNGLLMVVRASKDSSEGGATANGGVATKGGMTAEISCDKMIVSVMCDSLSILPVCDNHMHIM